MWGWTWLARFVQDLRYGLRTLRRAKWISVAAVTTMALGIGANTGCALGGGRRLRGSLVAIEIATFGCAGTRALRRLRPMSGARLRRTMSPPRSADKASTIVRNSNVERYLAGEQLLNELTPAQLRGE